MTEFGGFVIDICGDSVDLWSIFGLAVLKKELIGNHEFSRSCKITHPPSGAKVRKNADFSSLNRILENVCAVSIAIFACLLVTFKLTHSDAIKSNGYHIGIHIRDYVPLAFRRGFNMFNYTIVSRDTLSALNSEIENLRIALETEEHNSESLDQLCFKADDRIKLLEKQLAAANESREGIKRELEAAVELLNKYRAAEKPSKKASKKTTSAPKEQKATPKTKTSTKSSTKKPAAPAKPVGRPWNKLTKDEKHRLNAYAYRHLEECGGSWEGWEQKRLTLTFG